MEDNYENKKNRHNKTDVYDYFGIGAFGRYPFGVSSLYVQGSVDAIGKYATERI